MQTLLVIFSALAPVAVALWYIYRKDSAQPEPANWLFRAFYYGVLSTFLSLFFTSQISLWLGLDANAEPTSVLGAFANAFIFAGIPEELAKFLMLCLVLRKNPYFDEKFDGIVYAVCIGMGFAGLENVLYLMQGLADGSWVSTGIARALFSIPGHFIFAVLMGYYFSLYYFSINRSWKTMVMMLVAPILAHGIFDGILFSVNVNAFFAAFGMIIFLVFFIKIKRLASAHIRDLMNQ